MTAAIMIQLITGAIGSVGFGILFHIKKKYLPLAAVGGFLSWLVFLLGKEFWGNVFLPTLMAGFVTDVYAEILARICKETSTSFFVTSVIPLIPGSTLYYTMNAVVNANPDGFSHYGSLTVQYALSIAAGISVVWTFWSIFRKYRLLKTTEENRI